MHFYSHKVETKDRCKWTTMISIVEVYNTNFRVPIFKEWPIQRLKYIFYDSLKRVQIFMYCFIILITFFENKYHSLDKVMPFSVREY